jgi:hypothetical protein
VSSRLKVLATQLYLSKPRRHAPRYVDQLSPFALQNSKQQGELSHEALGELVRIVKVVRLARRIDCGVPGPDAFTATFEPGRTAIRSASPDSSTCMPLSPRIRRCRTAFSSGISSARFLSAAVELVSRVLALA